MALPGYGTPQPERVLAVLRGHNNRVSNLAFSPDGTRIATASYDNTARVWDAASGLGIAQLAGHSDIVEMVQFSPDGRYVVTASRDKSARLWDAATGEVVAELLGHTGEVDSAQFSPDGKWVLTVSQDGTARAWDAHTGTPVSRVTLRDIGIVLPGRQVSTGIFSPDGTMVGIAKLGNTNQSEAWVYPWPFFAPFEQLQAFASTVATRSLTCEERNSYLHEAGDCGAATPGTSSSAASTVPSSLPAASPAP